MDCIDLPNSRMLHRVATKSGNRVTTILGIGALSSQPVCIVQTLHEHDGWALIAVTIPSTTGAVVVQRTTCVHTNVVTSTIRPRASGSSVKLSAESLPVLVPSADYREAQKSPLLLDRQDMYVQPSLAYSLFYPWRSCPIAFDKNRCIDTP